MERIVYIKSYNPPKIDKNEILRYCKAVADDATLSLVDDCIGEAEDKLSYNVCYARSFVKIEEDNVDLGFCSVKSHSLARCLEGCCEIIVFAATVGMGIDRLINRYSIISPSRAVIFQALGSERVEALCDAFCKDLKNSLTDSEESLRSRFSPGYGDLSLEVQRDIFDFLNPTSKIGVTLNENCFMLPQKSVTAIIGVKKNENS